MPQVNIGVLLDQFGIVSPDDYFKLPIKDQYEFCSRIKSTAEHEKTSILVELKSTLGLKMHFHVSRHPEKGWQNIPNETFARKLAFFAAKSLITFPFQEVAHWRGEDIKPLLELLCTVRPFLKEGLVNILPSHNELRMVVVKQFNKKYGLVPANFQLDALENQFEEKIYGPHILNLYLPFFKDVKPEEVIRIRHDEKLLYDGLEYRLGRLLSGHDDLKNEESLLNELFEIDQHVRQLTQKFKGIQDALHRRDVFALIGFATVGLVLMFPPNVVTLLASVLGTGSLSALSYLQWKIEDAVNKTGELKEDKYYLLWRLNNLKVKS